MWENINKERKDSAHYSVMRKDSHISGMIALREMFPDAKADELNFVLFSTSGVHGTYNTIEESEKSLDSGFTEDGEEFCNEITFLIVHPRLVSLRYGVCNPENVQDIEYLKKLRQSSFDVMLTIGIENEVAS
jgi:hypothetical protein